MVAWQVLTATSVDERRVTVAQERLISKRWCCSDKQISPQCHRQTSPKRSIIWPGFVTLDNCIQVRWLRKHFVPKSTCWERLLQWPHFLQSCNRHDATHRNNFQTSMIKTLFLRMLEGWASMAKNRYGNTGVLPISWNNANELKLASRRNAYLKVSKLTEPRCCEYSFFTSCLSASGVKCTLFPLTQACTLLNINHSATSHNFHRNGLLAIFPWGIVLKKLPLM